MQNNNQDKNHHKIQPKKKNTKILILTEVSDQEAEIVTGGEVSPAAWIPMTWENND
ncbi:MULTISPECIES: hypothetical protein [Calothrix]|uniref:Anacyclamide n=2 Tax=Calothrix TaxID=1186 RepID=A0ABR8A5I3_9CYAN|nr:MULTISPECIES: hypothetical protein [Calothrix]MBD2195099.1 hypothetical protein [Calothrix parietina FACHB-288]MBD2223697.1 hypothetical protein [Calothrix anomala FACHB-343]